MQKKKNANTNRSQCSLNTNSPRANAAPGAQATYLFAFHQVLKLKGQESERQDRRPSEAQTTHFFSPKRMHLYSCKTLTPSRFMEQVSSFDSRPSHQAARTSYSFDLGLYTQSKKNYGTFLNESETYKQSFRLNYLIPMFQPTRPEFST